MCQSPFDIHMSIDLEKTKSNHERNKTYSKFHRLFRNFFLFLFVYSILKTVMWCCVIEFFYHIIVLDWIQYGVFRMLSKHGAKSWDGQTNKYIHWKKYKTIFLIPICYDLNFKRIHFPVGMLVRIFPLLYFGWCKKTLIFSLIKWFWWWNRIDLNSNSNYIYEIDAEAPEYGSIWSIDRIFTIIIASTNNRSKWNLK